MQCRIVNFETMIPNKRNQIYWLSQFTGWGIFVLGNILSAYVQETTPQGIYVLSLFIFVIGILITHGLRLISHSLNWKRLSIPRLIPRVLLSSAVMSIVFVLLNTVFTNIIGQSNNPFSGILSIPFLLNCLNFSALFLLWNILYYAVGLFENWKKEEIANLELKASQTEIELNSFKAQMNPHFMFNAMNSIRALVDEDPGKAKDAITSLSGILRNNLTLGKSQTIPLNEELDLVEKYLSLEKIRFEDRLNLAIQIDEDALTFRIPPFILQTIVENGIKHGVSKRIEGGKLHIKAAITNDVLNISVINSGEYILPEIRQDGREGIGILNSRKRLQLLYGNKASLKIFPLNDDVKVELVIPNIKTQKL